MATGDDALAAGMQIMTGNEPANTLGDEVNLTRDYIAQRTSEVTPIRKGGTGATTAAAARSALGVPGKSLDWPKAIAQIETSPAHQLGMYYSEAAGRVAIRVDATDFAVPKVDEVTAANNNAANALGTAQGAANTANQAKDGQMTTSVYNRSLGGSYHVCYANSDGLLGWVSSSRRNKENIEAATIDTDAILALQVVTFTYKKHIDPSGTVQHGLIAEDLHDAGLTWLVDYGDGDQPEGVRYDLLALALLPVMQSFDARLTALETDRG